MPNDSGKELCSWPTPKELITQAQDTFNNLWDRAETGLYVGSWKIIIYVSNFAACPTFMNIIPY